LWVLAPVTVRNSDIALQKIGWKYNRPILTEKAQSPRRSEKIF